MQLLTFSS